MKFYEEEFFVKSSCILTEFFGVLTNYLSKKNYDAIWRIFLKTNWLFIADAVINQSHKKNRQIPW